MPSLGAIGRLVSPSVAAPSPIRSTGRPLALGPSLLPPLTLARCAARNAAACSTGPRQEQVPVRRTGRPMHLLTVSWANSIRPAPSPPPISHSCLFLFPPEQQPPPELFATFAIT